MPQTEYSWLCQGVLNWSIIWKTTAIGYISMSKNLFQVITNRKNDNKTTSFVQNTKLGWSITDSVPIYERFSSVTNKPLIIIKANYLSALSPVSTKAATLLFEEKQAKTNFQSIFKIYENGKFIVNKLIINIINKYV